MFRGKSKIGIRDGGADAFATFADGFVGESDDVERRQPVRDVTLDRCRRAVVADADSGQNFRDAVRAHEYIVARSRDLRFLAQRI